MRPPILLCVFVIFGYTANAQLTITPQAGLENARTFVKLNNQPAFLPAGKMASPQAAVRLDYKFKHSYGPYVGLATSRSVVAFNFHDADNIINNYSATKGKIQLRLEGGFQVSSKRIYLKRTGTSSAMANTNNRKTTTGRSCLGYMRSSFCNNKEAKRPESKGKSVWMRIQPAIGIAVNPFAQNSGIYTREQSSHTNYVYNAGKWKTALISGVGFEFGVNKQSKLALNVNYVQGISNLGTQSITTVSGNKSTTTNLESASTSWNIRVGIPFSLSKRKSVSPDHSNYKGNRCSQNKGRCSKGGYKPGCNRSF